MTPRVSHRWQDTQGARRLQRFYRFASAMGYESGLEGTTADRRIVVDLVADYVDYFRNVSFPGSPPRVLPHHHH